MELISASAAMRQVVWDAKLAARFQDRRVLISGETGVGREHLARFVHHHSERRRDQFLVVSCAAGAGGDWTFAAAPAEPTPVRRLFREPNVGTIFLAGVEQLSFARQAALMRILDERLRDEQRGESSAGARLMASALPGLFDGVAKGWFSADLYYRLNTVHLRVPPLRERSDDVEPLLRNFIAIAALRHGVACPPFDERWRRVMHRYSWPGNARELRDLAESIVGRSAFTWAGGPPTRPH